YGWLPFDPTPAAPGAAPRPTPAGGHAATGVGSAPFPGAPKATPAGGAATVADNLARKNGLTRPHARASSAPAVTSEGGGSDRSTPALLLPLALAVSGDVSRPADAGLRSGRV